MLKLLALWKYKFMIMAVVQFIEQTVPDDMPGTRKLDMALKALIKHDAAIEKLVPEVTQLIGLAKNVYNEARTAAEPPAP